MVQSLSYFPGQLVSLYMEVTDGYCHVRTDSPTIPVVTRIIMPSLTLSPGYPVNMTQIDVGLYFFQFNLPVGAVSLGTYFVDMEYTCPSSGELTNYAYQILVTAPFGNYGTTSGVTGVLPPPACIPIPPCNCNCGQEPFPPMDECHERRYDHHYPEYHNYYRNFDRKP